MPKPKSPLLDLKSKYEIARARKAALEQKVAENPVPEVPPGGDDMDALLVRIKVVEAQLGVQPHDPPPLLRLSLLRDTLQRALGRAEATEEQYNNLQQDAVKALHKADTCHQAGIALSALETAYRKQLEETFSAIVTRAVNEVFVDEGNSVQVRQANTGTGLEIVAMRDGLETGIFDAKGGSFAQVVAFVLRAFLTAMHPGHLRRILILDEPFGMVSAEYRPRVAALIRTLADELDMQFLIVSHEPELAEAADVAYEVVREGDYATLVATKVLGEER